MKELKFIESGKKLREARKRAGLNQTEAAHAIGISQTYLSAVERGEHSLRLDQAAAIANAYGISVEHLTADSSLPAADPTAEDLLDKLRQKNRELAAKDKEIAELRAQLQQNPPKVVESPQLSPELSEIQDIIKALLEKPKFQNPVRSRIGLPEVKESAIKKKDIG